MPKKCERNQRALFSYSEPTTAMVVMWLPAPYGCITAPSSSFTTNASSLAFTTTPVYL